MATFKQQLASINARIVNLTAKRDELIPLAAAEVDVAVVNIGDVITFRYGRGETKAVMTGTVLGLKVPAAGVKGGTIIKVFVGEGVDAEIVGIFPSQIIKEGEEEVQQAEESAADSDASDEDGDLFDGE